MHPNDYIVGIKFDNGSFRSEVEERVASPTGPVDAAYKALDLANSALRRIFGDIDSSTGDVPSEAFAIVTRPFDAAVFIYKIEIEYTFNLRLVANV